MRRSVLVIDDEPLLRRLVRSMLERSGYEVHEAPSGRDGLQQIAYNRPDLIIVDMMMPGMDGFDVCKLVRSQTATAHLPVIMLSARTDQASQDAGMEAGATLCLQKPMGFRELIHSVQTILTTHAKID